MILKNQWKMFGGTQKVFTHQSDCTNTVMEFAVFEPPKTEEAPIVLYFLSGLTCTWENFVTKAGAQRAAALHNVVLVCPDTSPRGAGVPDCADEYDMGQGAGFYLNATQEPWSQNFQMESYVREELPALVETERALSHRAPAHRAICGHSMGGHGALTLGMRDPDFYHSISAFSPIVAPSQVPWGQKAFTQYLGEETDLWARYDACRLLEERGYAREILIDQGDADQFLENQLKPELFSAACEKAGVPLKLRLQPGYDHSYYFIASFIEDHLKWHVAQASQAKSQKLR